MAQLGASASGPRPPDRSSQLQLVNRATPADGRRAKMANRTPSRALFVGMVANLLVTFLILVFAKKTSIPGHVVGAIIGMFVSVVLLGIFRQKLNESRSDGRFADWRIPASKSSVMVTVAVWVLGVLHLFLIATEISRNFT